jgi:hypothetical protein
MKRLSLIVFLICALPSLARAQVLHANFFPTTTTLTCTSTSGTNISLDQFTGTLSGNLTLTLPAASAGCIDGDRIDIRATQAASSSYTLTVSAGTGTAVKVLSNGGTLIPMPAGASSGAANVLHLIYAYDSIASTPQWELVTQETYAAATTLGPYNMLMLQSLGGNGAGTLGGSNETYIWCGFYPFASVVTTGNIATQVSAADNTNNSDIGVYSYNPSTGVATLLFDTGAFTSSATSTRLIGIGSGSSNITEPSFPYYMPAGYYCNAWTSAATTFKLLGNNATGWFFYQASGATPTTSGGKLNASLTGLTENIGYNSGQEPVLGAY